MDRPVLLLVDTAAVDPLSFDHFLRLAASAGFAPRSQTVAELLDGRDHTPPPAALVVRYTEELLLADPGAPLAAAVHAELARLADGARAVLLYLPGTTGGDPPLLVRWPLDQDDARLDRFHRESSAYRVHPLGRPRDYETSLLPAPGAPSHPAPGPLAPLGALLEWPGRPQLVLGHAALLELTGPGESMHHAPLYPADRARHQRALGAALQALGARLGLDVHTDSSAPLEPPGPARPLAPRKTAWLDVHDFARGGSEDYRPLILRAAVAGRFDALWLALGPGQYTSPIGRYRDRRAAMEESLRRFTAELARAAAAAGQAPPAILAGLNLTHNSIAPGPLPPRAARDLFGQEYPDVPAPLDRGYWAQEGTGPGAALARWWREQGLELPLNGFVLDLEMYLRPVTGLARFLSTMGLEDEALAEALAGRWLVRALGALESRAEALGLWIRGELQDALPGAELAVYTPTLGLDPFHRGLYRGLRPRTLYSFHPRGRAVAPALEARGIDAALSSALLLSKISGPADFTRAARLLADNDGLWINRLSRVGSWAPEAWYALEQCPLDQEGRDAFYRAL